MGTPSIPLILLSAPDGARALALLGSAWCRVRGVRDPDSYGTGVGRDEWQLQPCLGIGIVVFPSLGLGFRLPALSVMISLSFTRPYHGFRFSDLSMIIKSCWD